MTASCVNESTPQPYTDRLMYGQARITGSGRITSKTPMPDKKGNLKKYAIEEWVLFEARVEASGNAAATLALANIHAHKMSEQDSQTASDILHFGVTPDCFNRMQIRLSCAICGDTETDMIALHYSGDPWDGTPPYKVALCRECQGKVIAVVKAAVKRMKEGRECQQS